SSSSSLPPSVSCLSREHAVSLSLSSSAALFSHRVSHTHPPLLLSFSLSFFESFSPHSLPVSLSLILSFSLSLSLSFSLSLSHTDTHTHTHTYTYTRTQTYSFH